MNPPDPVIIVGAGPIGLTTALGLEFHGIKFAVFEEDETLSLDTKAGTILTRTLEIFRRFGVADAVLQHALRVEIIGDIDRATNLPRNSIDTSVLRDETRYPFVINLPQHHLEPVLAERLAKSRHGAVHMRHRMTALRQSDDHVEVDFQTPDGTKTVRGSYVLACDGGRSAVRHALGIGVDGFSLDVRYMLVDVVVDLDVANPRDYPYLAYFADPVEWMILVRHPHCWRFLFPLPPDAPEPGIDELRAKVLHFIGETSDLSVIGKVIYRVHHRVAEEWRRGRALLMGDAAHLITPMWALGLNTGALDASSLPWRLAWVLRGWAGEALLDGYVREQRPIAVNGSGEMAEAARKAMSKNTDADPLAASSAWGTAATRCLLGVRLDVDGVGDSAMTIMDRGPPRVGDRVPDWLLHGADGALHRLHDLIDGAFLALYFSDVRRRPPIPDRDNPALRHRAVSRWDAPLDGGLRPRCLFDPGDSLFSRFGCAAETCVLIRPDEHIAAIAPIRPGIAAELYVRAVGAALPALETVGR
jgi:3-(3-hydroxy-phenyl)propionate hydroxylase